MSLSKKHTLHLHDPERIEVRDSKAHLLATFTSGAYTVVLAGPRRTFVEDGASVSHAKWVRAYPALFDGEVDWDWLEQALAANREGVPDVFAIAMQYIRGAPSIYEDSLQIAGDARYGPGTEKNRQEGADFNDYLGVTWSYPGEQDVSPEADKFHCLDCSGYMRMVWGYRHHLPSEDYEDRVPLSLAPMLDHSTMPRRTYEIYESAPGVVIVSRCEQLMDFSWLGIGDLVFFDAKGGPQIDHVGMYLGRDADRRHRFISSRKKHNGPTLGDYKGASLLDGTGFFAKAFCAVRRI